MHFWYSEKQADECSRMNDAGAIRSGYGWRKNTALINGKIVEYTVCSIRKDFNCLWDDAVYLGEGLWHSCIGEWW